MRAKEIDQKAKEIDHKVKEAAMEIVDETDSEAVRRLKDLPVRRKLTILSRTFIFGMVIIALLGGIGMWMISRQAFVVSKNWMPAVMVAQDMDKLASDYQRIQYAHVAALTEEEWKRYEGRLTELLSEMDEDMVLYENYSHKSEGKSYLEAAKKAWEAYVSAKQSVTEMNRAGNGIEAQALLEGAGQTAFAQVEDSMDELVQFNMQESQKSAAKINSTYIFAMVLMVGFAVAAVVVGGMISTGIRLLIIKALNSIRKALKELQNGNLDAELKYHSKDEFGELSDDIREFMRDLETIIKDENDILAKMSSGNFDVTSHIKDRYKGDFRMILDSMSEIKHKLGVSLSNIQMSSGQVNSASEQMAIAAQALAEGSSQQSASVTGILSMVKDMETKAGNGARRAGEASSYANDVKHQAEQGNEQMDRMMEEMHVISSTSTEIETIIGTIEEIAEQTNLLALNASIEAARRGRKRLCGSGRGDWETGDSVCGCGYQYERLNSEIHCSGGKRKRDCTGNGGGVCGGKRRNHQGSGAERNSEGRL